MSRKNTLLTPIEVNKSLSASFTSPVTVIRNLDNCSYQINLRTSDSIGTFIVQGSNDYALYAPTESVESQGNWIDLTLGGGTPFVNAANDNIIIDLNQLPFNALRVKYVSGTAGTGTCDIYLCAKQVGG